MQHKAFWVHNSETTLPNISDIQNKSSPQIGAAGASSTMRESRPSVVDVSKKIYDGYDPIPISKNERLQSPDLRRQDDTEEPNDMKLV